jgi:hypothetical protein
MMSLKEFFKNFITPDFNPIEVQKRIMEILDERIKQDDKSRKRPDLTGVKSLNPDPEKRNDSVD